MVLVVVAAFVVSWTPFFMASMINTLTGILETGNFMFVLCLIHTCGFINSMINPFIYVCMSGRFRYGMCNVMALFIYPCGGRRYVRNIEPTRRISLSDSSRSEQDFNLRRKSSAMSNISSDRRVYTSRRSFSRKESTLTNTNIGRNCDEATDGNSTAISITRQEQQSLMCNEVSPVTNKSKTTGSE
ncbi:mesotocin receptor-like [Anneissia japonica]|uniref:mesotocin receptor-like n=1 Tax=Anneissia japonica TaxID=1529436 RepID=UPI0014257B1C|nr:mesotocin receptor-like [Anneissia japonica]